jgi:ABC-2 type transport system permease protein
MQRILKVAHREYVETAKTKMFILGVLMTPVLIGAMMFFIGRISREQTGPRPPLKVAVTDLSQELLGEIKTSFDEYNAAHPDRQMQLQELQTAENPDLVADREKDKLRRGKLDIYVVLDKDVVGGDGKIRFYRHNPKAADLDVHFTIENLFRRAVVNRRYELQELDPELLAELRHVPTEQVGVGSAADEERIQTEREMITGLMVPFFFMFMMVMGILAMGTHMLNSVIEEKNSRVIEVLLSALSPFELMAGKILGLVGISLTVMLLWGGSAYAATLQRGININISTVSLLYFIIYFVLGFLLYTSILAAIGSICNTIKEAQSLMWPVTLLVIIPTVAWFNLARNPDGTLARVLSFIPPLTPMVMVLRIVASRELPFFEIAASTALLAAFVPVVMWVAAKVFRTGILMYGKRPGPRELLRWLRQS